MIRLYIIGLCILFIAIIANVLIEKAGISTWYNFGSQFVSKGFKAIQEVGWLSCFWLFICYPLILSLGYLIGDKIFKTFMI